MTTRGPTTALVTAATDPAGPLGDWAGPAVASPSAAEITALQDVRDHPCVSVLMTTTPSGRMLPADAARLRALAARAAERLHSEGPPGAHTDVLAAIDELVARAEQVPTGAAVAVYASPRTARLVHLPVPVRDRVVVDPTFATRDLVRALHRAPRHLVLVLAPDQAHLLEELGGSLVPTRGSKFPVLAGPHPRGAARGRARAGGTRAYLRTVERALGAYQAVRPAPLVLVGDERVLAGFTARSRQLARLAGVVTGADATAPLPQLRALIRPALDSYLHSRQQAALALLERRSGEGRCVSGMAAAWLAARHERPEVLVVEDTLVYPARLDGDGDLLTPAADVEHPEVIDDVVDELIEIVLARGGWVALADEGALAAHEGVALTLRNAPPR